MMEISVYLTLSPVESVLPRLLEKVYEAGERCLFRVPSEKTAEDWNRILWTYNQKSFLPHGSAKDNYAELQPIWITHLEENPNNSSVYLTVDALCTIPESGFKKGIDVISVNETNGISLAQKRIKEYTEREQKIKIWKQTPDGKWLDLEPTQVGLF